MRDLSKPVVSLLSRVGSSRVIRAGVRLHVSRLRRFRGAGFLGGETLLLTTGFVSLGVAKATGTCGCPVCSCEMSMRVVMSEIAEPIRFRSGELDLYGRAWHVSEGAPTILLLPGLGSRTFEYEPLGAALAAGDVNALAFDLRGHHRSDCPQGRWTLAELTTDTRAALDVCCRCWTGPMVLFGNSLGAMVSILTSTVDERVDGVVAANSPAHAADIPLTPPRRELYALLQLIEPVAAVRVSVNPYIHYEQLTDDSDPVATIRGDRLITEARRLSVRTYRGLLWSLDGPRAASRLHKPLLVLQGRHDLLQPPEQSELVYAAAHEPKQYERLDTGHLPHLDAPETLSAAITAWADTLDRRPLP
jgi:pimeloyl-ACP methyl ester carboxylesterase